MIIKYLIFHRCLHRHSKQRILQSAWLVWLDCCSNHHHFQQCCNCSCKRNPENLQELKYAKYSCISYSQKPLDPFLSSPRGRGEKGEGRGGGGGEGRGKREEGRGREERGEGRRERERGEGRGGEHTSILMHT